MDRRTLRKMSLTTLPVGHGLMVGRLMHLSKWWRDHGNPGLFKILSWKEYARERGEHQDPNEFDRWKRECAPVLNMDTGLITVHYWNHFDFKKGYC